MKPLVNLTTNKVVISTFGIVSGYKKAFSTVTSTIGYIKPLSPEKTNLYNGAMGKTHIIYIDSGVSINEGDRLKDEDTSAVYKVVTGGISRRTQGSMDFTEVIIEEVN